MCDFNLPFIQVLVSFHLNKYQACSLSLVNRVLETDSFLNLESGLSMALLLKNLKLLLSSSFFILVSSSPAQLKILGFYFLNFL